MAKLTDTKVPNIRFKGFEGEWEEEKLGELCLTTIGEFVIRTKQNPNGAYPVFNGGITCTGFYDSFNNEGDKIVISARGANAGYVNIVRKRYWAGNSCYSVSLKNKLNSLDFFYSFIKQNEYRFLENQQAANIPSISKSDVEKFGITLPTSEEQTKIGGYFRELDQLIGLQQRKHDKLVTLKRAMLQKMFPQPGATNPEIRFKGFSGNWVEKKLGDATANIPNNTLSRANLNYKNGLAKNVHYGDVLIKFSEILDVQNDGVPFISDDALASKLKHAALQDGDIVMADAAEDETVGKCSEIQNAGNRLVLAGLHTIALRPLISFAPFYLGYYLNANAFHNQLLRLMQGTKVLSISKTVIKETNLHFPTDKAEQKKIGTYFRTLDALISKHAVQLEKLKQLKSACLERMFV